MRNNEPCISPLGRLRYLLVTYMDIPINWLETWVLEPRRKQKECRLEIHLAWKGLAKYCAKLHLSRTVVRDSFGGFYWESWECYFLSLKKWRPRTEPWRAEQTNNILGDYYQLLASCTDLFLFFLLLTSQPDLTCKIPQIKESPLSGSFCVCVLGVGLVWAEGFWTFLEYYRVNHLKFLKLWR